MRNSEYDKFSNAELEEMIGMLSQLASEYLDLIKCCRDIEACEFFNCRAVSAMNEVCCLREALIKRWYDDEDEKH